VIATQANPDDPRWLLATVTLSSDVRLAVLDAGAGTSAGRMPSCGRRAGPVPSGAGAGPWRAGLARWQRRQKMRSIRAGAG